MQKIIYVEDINSDVVIARRKGTRSIRISIGSGNRIRLAVPYVIPEKLAIKFLLDKRDWILEHKKTLNVLRDGAHIGKFHVLSMTNEDIEKPKSRITKTEIKIKLPNSSTVTEKSNQDYIVKICDKALKIQADNLLPQRVKHLSQKHNIPFKSVSSKKLKSRWGSCDGQKNIILNIYLMQLDWRLIDYVILHELTHTIHHNHSADFWNYLDNLIEDSKERKKELKSYQTTVFAT